MNARAPTDATMTLAPLKRLQLFEFTDQTWCPPVVRSLVTEFIQSFSAVLGLYRPMTNRLARLLQQTQTDRILDLCSGSGGPLIEIERELRARGMNVSVRLSDKFPDHARLAQIRAQKSDAAIDYVPESIDATHVPKDVHGCRTLFEGLHHFPPNAARAILQNAVDHKMPIGIFEITERSPLSFFGALFIPLVVLLFTPLVRPFTWSRLLLTYLLPIASIVIAWDGFVSHWRTYSVDELREMTRTLEGEPYTWEIGTDHVKGIFPVTYLVGYPTKMPVI